MDSRQYDLAIIGGGINGAGIARDAAGRGLAVLLVEQGDLAGATSSASTKLIHGGLRYLEHRKFRLVREALAEREVLLRAAPHIIRPMRFVLPQGRGSRPWWMLRAGLFLYDRLGGRRILPGTRVLDLTQDAAGAPLADGFRRGFEYSDCTVDDSRLVVLAARDAADRGADIRVRTRCVGAQRDDGLWHLTLFGEGGGNATARVLVNATGPWVGRFLAGPAQAPSAARVRLVKGSHIVTRALFDHDRSYIFQNPDGRICFAIPYQDDFTLIGTTDTDMDGDPMNVAVDAAEVTYLCDAVSRYLRRPVGPADVVWSFAGARALYDDGARSAQEATRDYVLQLDAEAGAPPLLSVFGGKITTHRRLAEAALDRLAPFLPGMRGAWTATAHLPGGDFQPEAIAALGFALRDEYPFLSWRQARRLAFSYGTQAPLLLDGAQHAADLGRDFGGGLHEREVRWMMEREWARSAEDILWRRSKLGLVLDAAQRKALAEYVISRRPQD